MQLAEDSKSWGKKTDWLGAWEPGMNYEFPSFCFCFSNSLRNQALGSREAYNAEMSTSTHQKRAQENLGLLAKTWSGIETKQGRNTFAPPAPLQANTRKKPQPSVPAPSGAVRGDYERGPVIPPARTRWRPAPAQRRGLSYSPAMQ